MNIIPKRLMLQKNDLHFVFNDKSRKLKCFDATGKLRWTFECRNDAQNDGYGHYGKCPKGEYELAAPQEIPIEYPPSAAFGKYFIALKDVNGLWKDPYRDYIGLHGGGSGLPDPFAPLQGWVITHGCFRLQNVHLARVVDSVRFTLKNGGKVYLTVG